MKTASRFTDFSPYTPIEPFEVLSKRLGRDPEKIIKLDANENSYGPSAKARQALAEIRWPHIYPDPESRALRTALADFTGVPMENLVAGAGADELIDLTLRLILEPGDKVINCPPTFGMYSFETRLNAGEVISIQREPDFSINLDAIKLAIAEHQPKAIFLTTPNNPDGGFPEPETIDALLDLPVLVILDEAYIEFIGAAGGRFGEKLSRIQQVPQRDNLIVLRTFSKWAGLAGLRIGYGAFPNWILSTLWKAKQPYNVNVAANVAALASLEDLDYLSGNVARLRAERDRLYDRLKSVPFLHPYPSLANFILCQVENIQAIELKDMLLQQGIMVRYYDTPLLENYIRISIGRPEENKIIYETLMQIASERSLT
ncbi:MAG: histidinol-phosphate transaminase [Anaerolineaceae bacterium]|nr:histidinol-phosphate transaminase [Anaerolineaceae bacterium]